MADQPTFLFGLGATKAGTSWLWRYLSGHPDCHLRSVKELHYFDSIEKNRLGGELRKARAELEKWRDAVAAADGARAAQLARRLGDLRDWIRVLARGQGDLTAYRAYLTSDGAAGPGRVVGDITPAYALLPVARLREMAALAADVRFIYLMRDPVARLWSHVRMLARRHAPEKDFATAALALLRRICAGETGGQAGGVVARGDYAAALARFDCALDPARLLVMFQEELMTLPGIARLTGFLGIGAHPADLGRRVHSGAPLKLPAADRAAALAFLRPQYEAVARRFGTLPQAWRGGMGAEGAA